VGVSEVVGKVFKLVRCVVVSVRHRETTTNHHHQPPPPTHRSFVRSFCLFVHRVAVELIDDNDGTTAGWRP